VVTTSDKSSYIRR